MSTQPIDITLVDPPGSNGGKRRYTRTLTYEALSEFHLRVDVDADRGLPWTRHDGAGIDLDRTSAQQLADALNAWLAPHPNDPQDPA